jgi:tetratricopeptide (TPR) repeat protein
VYARLGGLALEQARLDEGSESLGQARLLARQGGDKAALGVVSFGLGVVGQQRGQYLAAVLHYTEALQAFRQADHRYGICQVYHRFGELHAAQQRWPEALKCYAESARLARQMGAVSLLAHILAGTALAQLGAGDGAAASASCAAARMYMEQMGDRRGLAECDKVEGVIHRQQAQYAPAEELLERGRKLYLVLGIRLGVAECERELGLLLQGCGDVEGARQRLQESSALFGRIGAREEARRAEELLAALAA